MPAHRPMPSARSMTPTIRRTVWMVIFFSRPRLMCTPRKAAIVAAATSPPIFCDHVRTGQARVDTEANRIDHAGQHHAGGDEGFLVEPRAQKESAAECALVSRQAAKEPAEKPSGWQPCGGNATSASFPQFEQGEKDNEQTHRELHRRDEECPGPRVHRKTTASGRTTAPAATLRQNRPPGRALRSAASRASPPCRRKARV